MDIKQDLKMAETFHLICSYITLFYTVYAHESDGTWSYDGSIGAGPDHWAEHWPLCGGTSQSPIDLSGNQQYNDSLTKFVFHGFGADSLGSDDLTLMNVGWTEKVVIKDSSQGRANFSGGGYDGTYIAAQLHFHWGANNSLGSDHTVNGSHYPLSLHMAFYKAEYGNISEALKHLDGATILVTFFKISEDDNSELQPFFDALNNTQYEGESEPFGHGLEMFLPSNKKHFYKYHGSFTHPPCLEIITWTIFQKPRSVSQNQLDKLRQLYDGEEDADNLGHILNNGRPVQDLGDRIVYTSCSPDTSEDDDDSCDENNDDDENGQ